MTEQEIKEIFMLTFNGHVNPIFQYPLKYFEHNGYLCEVAAANKPQSLDWKKVEENPLHIFDALFVTDKLYVTTLEKNGDTYNVVNGLTGPIETIEEAEKFIKDKLANGL